MMTTDEIKAVAARCTYDNWDFDVLLDGDRPYLQIRATTPCNVSGGMEEWKGRKWLLSPHMTTSEIVMTCFKALHTAIEHETRERFTFDGVTIFDPHFDVTRLAFLRMAGHNGCLDVRAAISTPTIQL